MARFLALDWDHKQLHIVAAQVTGGKVRIEKVALIAEDQVPNPAEAAALGQRLRGHLKAAGIAPAPVLACVGRDRIILKEVRYPAVPPAEEPALVRFQAAKELTEPIEDVVLDYAPVGDTGAAGERRALAVIVRRDLLGAYQTLCETAGLKLAALVPRPFALLACLNGTPGAQTASGTREPGEGLAILGLTERSAELCMVRGDSLLFARSLATGPALAGEVRRSLAVYAGQWPLHPVRNLYVADGGDEHESLCQRLQELLAFPVQRFDPFAGTQSPQSSGTFGGAFAAAVGLLHAQTQRRPLPVNFVQPKEPRPPSDTGRRNLMLAGGLAAALVLATIGFGYAQLAKKDRQLQLLQDERTIVERQLHQVQEDEVRIGALDDWCQTEISWVDELYDLTDRFPDVQNLRLVQLTVEPLTRTAKAKNSAKHVASISLKGIMTENYQELDALIAHLVDDGHYRVAPKQLKPNTSVDRIRFRQEFSTHIDVEKRLPTQYTRRLPSPAGDRGGRQRGQGMDFGFDPFGGGQP